MTPEQPQLPFRPIDLPLPPGTPVKPVHPLARFFFAVILVVAANVVAAMFSFASLASHPLLADSVYRWGASAILLAGYIFFTRVLDRWEGDPWSYMGLPLTASVGSQLLIGIAIGGVLITLAVAAIAVIGSISIALNFSARALGHELLVVFLLIGGALLEELSFRGYPFQRLVDAIRPTGAIIVFSVFFGAVHLQNPHAGGLLSWGFFNTILVGVLFAYAYLRSGTLWLPIGMHFGWNFFLGVVYGLPVSGLREFSILVRSTAKGSALLTGGGYGLEASLTGTLVLLLGFLLVAWAPKPEIKSVTAPQHTGEPGI